MERKLRNIADYLLLRSSHMQDIGLFHGKMGIAVALYMYADRYNDTLMEEYAWDLFQQVYDGVHRDMAVGLEAGLAGIGYGTTLLRKHGLVECDLNDILTEVDSKIMERDPRRMTDLSIRNGIGGLQLYLDLRRSTGEPLATFDQRFLSELNSAAANMTVFNAGASLIEILNEPPFAIDEYVEKPLGIDGGDAYYILKDILA